MSFIQPYLTVQNVRHCSYLTVQTVRHCILLYIPPHLKFNKLRPLKPYFKHCVTQNSPFRISDNSPPEN